MSRAKRSGPTRGKDTAWLREQVTRNVDPPAELELSVRFAEREVERLRKSAIKSMTQDQRLAGRARATDNATKAWKAKLAWHLTTHHGVPVTVTREHGFVFAQHDGRTVGVWTLDRLHEEAHDRRP